MEQEERENAELTPKDVGNGEGAFGEEELQTLIRHLKHSNHHVSPAPLRSLQLGEYRQRKRDEPENHKMPHLIEPRQLFEDIGYQVVIRADGAENIDSRRDQNQ